MEMDRRMEMDLDARSNFEDLMEKLLSDDYETLIKSYTPLKGTHTHRRRIKPGQKVFAPLDYPGFTTPYEVVEGGPGDREILIRKMDVEMMATEMTITAVRPNPENPVIKAVRAEQFSKLFKSEMGLHRLAATPLAKEALKEY